MRGVASIVAYVAGRLAVVIGSECAALNQLGFPSELAGDLQRVMAAGGWQPVGGVAAPVINPGIAELRTILDRAFYVAHDQQSTLLIAFIGHGATTASEDFYLLAHDSPARPKTESAFHLAQGIRERLDDSSGMDGLILLVDACQAGEGIHGAARRWIEIFAAGGRMELLVASGDGNAYAGCFTRTLLATFVQGLPYAGENLLCTNLVHPLEQACPKQLPHHLSFAAGAGAASSDQSDPGLFLVPNLARRADAVSGLPSAGLVDQLTRGLVVTEALTQKLTEVAEADHARLRLVMGPAGCGKSTLVALLIRPALIDVLDADTRYVDAAVFLDLTSSVATVTEDLVARLDRGLTGFAAAREQIAAELAAQPADEDRDGRDSFELQVTRPLQRCRKPGRRIRLLIDGLDQPDDGARDHILTALSKLAHPDQAGLDHVRVILTVRTGTGIETRPELTLAHRVQLQPPDAADVARALDIGGDAEAAAQLVGQVSDGGWLIARLLRELHSSETMPTSFENLVDARLNQAIQGAAAPAATRAVIGALAAAGPGPILPLTLLAQVLQTLGEPLSTSQLRDVLVQLGAMVSRGKPGQPNEQVGIAHAAVAEALVAHTGLSAVVAAAHRAFAAACSAPQPADITPQVADYINRAGPRHHLLSGDSAAALAALAALDGPRAADNRDRWSAWVPSFTDALGPNHPHTLTTRHKVAYWTGEAGDVVEAVQLLRELLPDQQRVLEPSHPDTLNTRHHIAHWTGAAGNAAEAVRLLRELLPDQQRVFGPDHPDTLATRSSMATWTEDVAESLRLFRALLPDQQRVLGIDHADIAWTRLSLANRTGRAGDLTESLRLLRELLLDLEGPKLRRVFGPDHTITLLTRLNIASKTAAAGDLAEALRLYRALLPDQQRVFGPNHPVTLETRRSLAHWTGKAENAGYSC